MAKEKKKKSLKSYIIMVLIFFSAVVTSSVIIMLYFNLKYEIEDFNRSILESNREMILDSFDSVTQKGKKIITDTNDEIFNKTRTKIDKFIKETSKNNNKTILEMFESNFKGKLLKENLIMKNELNAPIFWWDKYREQEDFFAKKLRKSELYSGFIVYDETIDPVLKIGNISENFNLDEAMKVTRNKKVYYSNVVEKEYIYLGYSILDDEKKYNGFVVGKYKIKNLLEDMIKGINLGSDRTIFVTDSNRTIIDHKNDNYDGVKFSRVTYDTRKDMQQIVTGDIIYTIYKIESNSQEVLSEDLFIVIKEYIQDAFSGVEELKKDSREKIELSFNSFNEKLNHEFDETIKQVKKEGDLALGDFVKKIYKVGIMVFGFGILISILIGIFLANSMVNPISDLLFAVKKISSGNLNYELSEESLKRRDELGVLANEFTNMKNDLIEMIEISKKLERKKAQAERLSSVGQLVSGVVHEIKNPLASISGFAELLRGDVTEDEIERYSKVISNETDRLNKLVQDLLEYSRPGDKSVQGRIRIRLLVDQVLDKLAPRISKKHIKVNLEMPNNIPPILGDKDKIIQVFMNIISNSIEAIKRSNKEITITGERKGNKVIIRCRDNGPGIPNNIKDKIFMPFTSHKKNGTGLGLAMVKKIIEDHNGTIRINKDYDNGAEFIIVFPIKYKG
ncbi:MAG: ATP-binding protein [Fusobacteriota bacterium]